MPEPMGPHEWEGIPDEEHKQASGQAGLADNPDSATTAETMQRPRKHSAKNNKREGLSRG